MHWSRWGDPDAATALPEPARALVEMAFGPLQSQPSIALGDVHLPDLALPLYPREHGQRSPLRQPAVLPDVVAHVDHPEQPVGELGAVEQGEVERCSEHLGKGQRQVTIRREVAHLAVERELSRIRREVTQAHLEPGNFAWARRAAGHGGAQQLHGE